MLTTANRVRRPTSSAVARKVLVISAYDLEQTGEAFAAFGAGTLGNLALTVA
ncbi:hypothetical protein HEK616_35070 [Streptomyces nigrescens]|uniref:Uncharacterized protein n=1 Tax=Streptomyces nigrescens TaxID=1920 RepID=A0ABM7ZUG7_STRNI|nr:hypothetical protein HEK616_35070 [Streptomyces nigrescens]